MKVEPVFKEIKLFNIVYPVKQLDWERLVPESERGKLKKAPVLNLPPKATSKNRI